MDDNGPPQEQEREKEHVRQDLSTFLVCLTKLIRTLVNLRQFCRCSTLGTKFGLGL